MVTWSESAWFSTMAGAALKGTVVLGAAWLAAFAMRRRSAAARHLVWTAAAAAVLAIPFLQAGLPALSLPAETWIPRNTGLVFQVLGTAREAIAQPSVSPASLTGHPATAEWRPNAAMLLLWIWAAGTALVLLQLAGAYFALCRQSRRAARLGWEGDAPVLEGPGGSMPMAFGFLRPVIFLPADAAGWSEERRRMVLLHEHAHIRRGDLATHLLARMALALHWWNPLAWIAWREFVKERERAADDLVLTAGARASDYAGHLLAVARSMQSGPAT